MFTNALLVFLFLTTTTALPQGAPRTVCQSMLPNHGGGIAPQTSISPFSVIPTRERDGVVVTITSNVGVQFQGFMLQARTTSKDILGSFDLSKTDEGHTIDCSGPGDTATHNSPSAKGSLDVLWKPPQGYEGAVIFTATVAQGYDTFWVGIESNAFEIRKDLIDVDVPPPQLPNRPITTTPTYFTPDIARESATDFDPFYDGCSSSKLCFGSPGNCVQSRSCKAVVAVTVSGDKYDFELKGYSNAAWVGVGLSEDNKMGDDSVVECVKRATGVASFMSWTSGLPNYAATRLRNPQLGIQLLNGSVIEDVIYCKVRRDAVTNVNGKQFDLVNEKYNLLIASGSSVSSTGVTFHDITFTASAQQQALSDVSALQADNKLLVRIHGSFMLAAWLGTASVGILLARYYRQTWVGSSCCGKDLWFAWHRTFMVLTWALTVAGFVLIFVELKAWSAENNPHAILGTVTTILCFIQPIGAYFRPHPGTSKRPLFNWLHWLIGNAAHIVAIVTIFFAIKLTKAELPQYLYYVLAAYVAFHVITHIILSIMSCISEKSSEGRVSAFPMNDLGSGRNSAYADRSADAPYQGFRKFILGIYIVIVLLFVVALIVITVLAPIEETWKSLRS